MGIIRGICTSDIRGIQKSEVQEADIEVDWGIVGDAHGGKWHRQISVLSDCSFPDQTYQMPQGDLLLSLPARLSHEAG